MVKKMSWWCSREWHTNWRTYWKGKIRADYKLILCRHSGYHNVPLDQRLFDMYISEGKFSTMYPIGTFSLADLKSFKQALEKTINTIIRDEVSGKEPEEFVKEL